MSGVEKTFTEAKRKLLRNLLNTKAAYQDAINNTRKLTKDEADAVLLSRTRSRP